MPMVSTRKVLAKKLSAKQVASLVARQIRFGRRIQLHQLASVPATKKEATLLKRYVQEIIVARQEKPSSLKLARLTAKVKVLRTVGVMRKRLRGRQPTVFQILAVTALRYGLNSSELKSEANAMNSLWKDARSSITWVGAPQLIARAIGRRLPDSIEGILLKAKSKAVNSKTIAKKVGIEWNPKNQDLINTSLQLLEVAGLVKKMPLSPQPAGGQLSVWVHASNRNPPIDYPNVEIDILNRLRRSSKLITDLHKQYQVSYGRRIATIGKANAIFSTQVYKTVVRLEEAGLVKIKTEGKRRERAGTVEKMRISLTPLGKQLLAEHNKSRSTPESLRQLLLGEQERPQN